MRKSIIIVGVGRSGTSLVQSMLAAHGSVIMLPESGFCRRYVASRRLLSIFSTSGKEGVVRALETDKRVARLSLPIQELVDGWDAGNDRHGNELYAAIVEYFRQGRPESRVGDKDPRLIEYLGLVRRTLLQVDIVHVIRDPRDVLASKKKAEWSRNRATVRHILAGLIQLRMGLLDGRRYFGGHYHEVCYEALVKEPEKELRLLCSRLDLPFEKSMLQFQKSAESLLSADEESWKKETTGPLLSKNWGKWRRVLGPIEAELTRRAFSHQLRNAVCEYQERQESLTVAQRALAATGAQILLATAAGLVTLRRAWRMIRAVPR